MEEIDLYFRDPQDTKIIRNLPDFMATFQYDVLERIKQKENEYGKILLDKVIIRIIHDRGINNNCPWCGRSEITVKTDQPENSGEFIKMYCECNFCFSRGPRLNIRPQLYLKDFEDIIYDRYKIRKVDFNKREKNDQVS